MRILSANVDRAEASTRLAAAAKKPMVGVGAGLSGTGGSAPRVSPIDKPLETGRICFNRQKINLSTVFAGQNVDVKEVSDKIWLVSFM